MIWLAGLIEGEGCFSYEIDKHDRRRFKFHLEMTDEDVVRRAATIWGHGSVRPRKPRRPHHKPTFVWAFSKQGEVYALAVALYPWMGERRQKKLRQVIGRMTA